VKVGIFRLSNITQYSSEWHIPDIRSHAANESDFQGIGCRLVACVGNCLSVT